MLYRTVLATLLFGAVGAAHAIDNTEALANTCNNCHGVNGVSAGQSMPSIGGQPESYLKNIMLEWKTGARYSATMGRLIKGYSDEQIAALAAYFSKKPWTPVAQTTGAKLLMVPGRGWTHADFYPKTQTTDAKLVALGKKVSARCAGCHGETGASSDGDTPNLNGQWAEYLELELMKYRDHAVAMPNKQMRNAAAAEKLSDEEVKAVAAFYASQKK